MATMTVSLPAPLKDWVEAQARTGRYSDASDYARDLISQDRERTAAIGEIQRRLDKGLESGISDRSMEQVLDVDRDLRHAGRSSSDRA